VPVFTPTPDLRGVQELFDTALQQIADGAWEDAINTLKALRENDLTFRTVQVDGLLYIALRNRGIQKILSEGSLEPGIYDLSLAERFAPLDSRAEGLRTWTRFYLTGASFWDVDWSQVVFYFEQVYPHLPNLRDGTFMTATERYRIGAIEYASQLLAAGEYCLAQEYFEKALAISEDSAARTLSESAAEACLLGLAPPEEPQPETATPTPGEESAATPLPTEEQTEVPTLEPTEEPTQTPTEEGGG
jgi:tetratricopeptide (TPR) repeat protein